MRQIFDREPFGDFVRAQYPLVHDVSDRAIQLATAAVGALPATRGYIGIDMVISHTDPGLDCLIEVNPRLTMSYLNLRELYRENLARVMLETVMLETVMLETVISSADSRNQSHANQRCIFRAPDL
jgi:predicted ATP-grasp superfamily ATP-dependent carboligase